MQDEREEIIRKAIIEKLSSGFDYFTADDILTVAEIDETQLKQIAENICPPISQKPKTKRRCNGGQTRKELTMKFLETRTEIAKAINFKQYPTIRIDVSKTDDYGIVGTHVLIDNGTFRTGEPYYVRATIRAFRDEGYLKFKSYGCCLHADFTYYDMEKILDYANVPVIKADQEILVCLLDSVKRLVYKPVVLKTGAQVDPHCQTPLTLEKFMVPDVIGGN